MSTVEKAKVAIVGAGPAGIGAAVRLARLGVGPIAVIERESKVGGIPARYTGDDIPTYVMWTSGRVVPGHRYAEKLGKELSSAGVVLHLESTVIGLDGSSNTLTIVSPGRGQWQLSADAIVLACGARESSRIERGWIYGHRPAGVYFTSNILDLASRTDRVSASDTAIVGSEVMGYAAAAKLAKSGSRRIMMADDAAHPRSLLAKRLFFYRWARPQWMNKPGHLNIRGKRSVESIELASGENAPARQVAVTGQLVPNSELLAEADLPVDALTRRPKDINGYRSDDSGIFLAGNVLGLSCSGQWAYFTGKWAATKVARFLSESNK